MDIFAVNILSIAQIYKKCKRHPMKNLCNKRKISFTIDAILCLFLLHLAVFFRFYQLQNSLLPAVLESAVRDDKPPDTSPLRFAAELMPVQAVPARFK